MSALQGKVLRRKKYFSNGNRGVIYTAELSVQTASDADEDARPVKVAVKELLHEKLLKPGRMTCPAALESEARWLRLVNEHGATAQGGGGVCMCICVARANAVYGVRVCARACVCVCVYAYACVRACVLTRARHTACRHRAQTAPRRCGAGGHGIHPGQVRNCVRACARVIAVRDDTCYTHKHVHRQARLFLHALLCNARESCAAQTDP